MPAPEQAPVMEECLLQTIPDGSGDRSMEADSNATNILASVKEQPPIVYMSQQEGAFHWRAPVYVTSFPGVICDPSPLRSQAGVSAEQRPEACLVGNFCLGFWGL
ncbi:hypothetical protein SKAU_G00237250 [Synaphobranchus kaupii]|uniref:Uncharacterized protein n=1 Tax=Synaphobranchus kaupii TaxID=118154 RepID=A0A9Q1F6V4_SYNKA|nr:hypothetical protein SKAU_G00237250 [Synaphobranchus kaupii]